MPKFVVAFNNDSTEGRKALGAPLRIAKSAIGHVKEAVRKYPGSHWELRFYNIKPSVENICQLVQNIKKFKPEEEYEVEVRSNGQVRKV